MSNWCKRCGRKKHAGLCDMVELTDGRIVHARRVDIGNDVYQQLGKNGLKVKNRWIKKDMIGKGNKKKHVRAS